MMSRVALAVAAALVLSAAAPPVVLAASDEAVLHDYVLTTDKLRHYAEFMKALHAQAHDPAFKAEVARIGDPPDHATIAQHVAYLRSSPMLVDMLHQHGLSEQDVVLLPIAVTTAAMAASLAPTNQAATSTVSSANIDFVRAHQAEVKTAMAPGG